MNSTNLCQLKRLRTIIIELILARPQGPLPAGPVCSVSNGLITAFLPHHFDAPQHSRHRNECLLTLNCLFWINYPSHSESHLFLHHFEYFILSIFHFTRIQNDILGANHFTFFLFLWDGSSVSPCLDWFTPVTCPQTLVSREGAMTPDATFKSLSSATNRWFWAQDI